MKEESQFTKVMDALTPLGLTINWLLLPFFIYEINKSRRRKTPIGIGYLEFDNHLQGYSCADIESILWSYGIPTHFVHIFFDREEQIITDGFYVPNVQHFMADCILRQNEEKYGYVVTSPIVYQGEIPSTRYKNKQWKRWGVMVKQKSWVNRIGLLLFGNMLSQSYPPKKEKKDNEKKNKKNKKNTKRKSER